MKIFITAIAILFTILPSANASEITGFISTNPNSIVVPVPVTPPSSTTNSNSQTNNTNQEVMEKKVEATTTVLLKKEKTLEEVRLRSLELQRDEATDEQKEEEVMVLGVIHFAEHSLLRGHDRKIYLTEGVFKKPIRNLIELRQYRGQTIFDVSDDDLKVYKTRNFLIGDLIRQIGDKNIYCIEMDKLKRVLGQSELRNRFFGKEIFNISKAEMLLYKY